MDPAEARLVEQLLDEPEQRLAVERLGERGAAGVAGQGRREDLVASLERGQDELPRPPRVEEAVQQQEPRALAAAMRRGKRGQRWIVTLPATRPWFTNGT